MAPAAPSVEGTAMGKNFDFDRFYAEQRAAADAMGGTHAAFSRRLGDIISGDPEALHEYMLNRASYGMDMYTWVSSGRQGPEPEMDWSGPVGSLVRDYRDELKHDYMAHAEAAYGAMPMGSGGVSDSDRFHSGNAAIDAMLGAATGEIGARNRLRAEFRGMPVARMDADGADLAKPVDVYAVSVANLDPIVDIVKDGPGTYHLTKFGGHWETLRGEDPAVMDEWTLDRIPARYFLENDVTAGGYGSGRVNLSEVQKAECNKGTLARIADAVRVKLGMAPAGQEDFYVEPGAVQDGPPGPRVGEAVPAAPAPEIVRKPSPSEIWAAKLEDDGPSGPDSGKGPDLRLL